MRWFNYQPKICVSLAQFNLFIKENYPDMEIETLDMCFGKLRSVSKFKPRFLAKPHKVLLKGVNNK